MAYENNIRSQKFRGLLLHLRSLHGELQFEKQMVWIRNIQNLNSAPPKVCRKISDSQEFCANVTPPKSHEEQVHPNQFVTANLAFLHNIFVSHLSK